MDQVYPTPVALRDVDLESPIFKDLVGSICKIGLFHPISVEQTDQGYKIVDGLHRYMAFKALNKETIFAQVYK